MKKYMLSLVALVVAVAAMAFTNVSAPAAVIEEEPVAVQYQFNGTDMNEVYNLQRWSEVTGNGPSCGGGDLPCVVTIDSGTLEDWLDERDEARILEDASSRKP